MDPTSDRDLALVRRFNLLMDDLDRMVAAAGGWRSRIPADQLAAWTARKRQLVADMEAASPAAARAAERATGKADSR